MVPWYSQDAAIGPYCPVVCVYLHASVCKYTQCVFKGTFLSFKVPQTGHWTVFDTEFQHRNGAL